MEKRIKYKSIGRSLLITCAISSIFGTIQARTAIDADSAKVALGIESAGLHTGAISTVSGEELRKGFVSNIANTLYGKISGLTVEQGSGEAGANSPTLSGRGLATYGSGYGLMYVIDGMPSTNLFFEQLVPEEIESVSLLKDAAATALYGNRAANGVLVVKTKRGFNSPLKVSVGAEYGFQQAVRLPNFLDSYDYATLYNEALANEGKSPMYSAADLEAYRNGSDPLLHPNVNWYDELLRKAAPVANYNFSARGGNDRIAYYVMFNAVTQNGLYKRVESLSDNSKNSTYSRFNFRTNIDLNISKNLSAHVSMGATVEDKTNSGVDANTYNVFELMNTIAPNAFPIYVSPGMLGGTSTFKSPLGEIAQAGSNTANGRSAQAQARLTEKLDWITPGLSISAGVGFNTYFVSNSIKSRDYERFLIERDNAGEFLYTKFGENTSLTGNESAFTLWRNLVVQASLDYKRTFGRHSVEAMFMSNYDDYTITSGSLPYRNAGIAGRATYGYDKRYIAEFSFGYNGTENYPRGHRFGFFPTGSVAWVISNEKFLENNDIIDYLKLRASYGLTGNHSIGGQQFMFNQYYVWKGSYYLGSSNSSVDRYEMGSLANPDVTWEKEKQTNIGLDATLFKGLDISVDYYIRNRYDILSKPYSTVPDFLGINLPDMNVGKVRNTGFETALRYNTTSKKGVNYFIGANISFTRNEVTYNAEAPQVYDYLYSTGHRINQPFAFEAIGFFKDQADIDRSPKQVFDEVVPGDIKYKDQNGDGIIDNNDKKAFGYTQSPEWSFGLHGGFNYNGFDLDIMFHGVANRTVYWEGKRFQAFQNSGKISEVALKRWTPETAETATYPRLSTDGNQNNYQYSTFWQKNGNFLKLRNLEFGYTLPERLTNKIKLEKLRVFANATNLFSLDHMEGQVDPETLYGHPAIRTFSLGLNLQF